VGSDSQWIRKHGCHGNHMLTLKVRSGLYLIRPPKCLY
jgi:hypothetical protein